MKLLHLLSDDTNVYVLVNDDNRAVLIDAGEDYAMLKEAAARRGFKITACLLTHGHFDHAGACARLQEDGVKIYISSADADKLYTDGNLGKDFGHPFARFTADFTFDDGDMLKIEGFDFKVMITPGHSRGSACFLCGNYLFSGDTLFYENVGRTDLYDGSGKDMKASLNRLLMLDGDYTVYPGHGRATTLAHEREANPFI